MKESVHSDKLHSSLAPISHAIKCNGMVFVSGKIGLSKDGTQPGDVHAEMRQAMENFSDCLEAAGCTFANVVKMTVMVKNMDDFSRVNEVYKEFFSPPYPARSCFEVAKLPRNMNVEVEGIAML